MPRHKYGAGSVYKRGKTYWLSYYANGEHICESGKTKDKVEAKRQLQQRLGEIAEGRFVGPRMDRIAVDELLNDVLEDYRINNRSMKDITRTVPTLLSFFGGKPAQSITPADVAVYVRRRLDAGYANGTVNRELNGLRRAFNLGLQNDKIIRKPHIARLEENNVRQGFFEWQEFNAVKDRLPDYLKPVMEFGYLTGWRSNAESLRLKWHNVDHDGETIRLDPGTTKNKDGRVIYMFPELQTLLEDQWQATLALQREMGCIIQLVFHNEGRPIVNYYKAWQKACREAGLSGKLPHDFRRTAVRNMVKAGIPERVAMQMTGHKTRSVFDRYHIVSYSDLKEAAKRLSRANLATDLATITPLPVRSSDVTS